MSKSYNSSLIKRIKSLSNKDNFETISYCDQNCDLNIIEKTKHFPIPYVKGASEKFKLALNKYKVQPAYKPMNNLHKYIKTGKDKAKKEELSNVVYKIDCKNCNYSYVGQTKRKLKTRLKEHINDIKKPIDSLSVISNHRIDNEHVMDWDNTRILDSERAYYKRLISEMIHIKTQRKVLNKQSDTERFPDVYLPLLEQ